MSEESKSNISEIVKSNLANALVLLVMAWGGWSVKSAQANTDAKIESMHKDMTLALQQNQMDSAAKFVAKDYYQTESLLLKQSDANNAAAIANVSTAVAGLHTDVEVLKIKIAK